MKLLLITLFVAAATAIPIPDDDGGPVEVLVNGVSEGHPLELGGIVDVKLKEHVNGQVVASTNVLHPFTAEGIAESQPAEVIPEPAAPEVVPEPVVIPEPIAPEVVLPEPVVIPEPVAPEVVLPEPVVIPEPVAPEVVLPEPVVIPEPVAPEVVLPEPVVIPEPVAPEVVPEPVVIPEPAAPEVIPDPGVPEIEDPAEPVPIPAPQFPNGEVFNDGSVSVSVNGPQETGVLATLQSWFHMVINYISNGATTSQQIV